MKRADSAASAPLKRVIYNVINSSLAQLLSELPIKCTKMAIMDVGGVGWGEKKMT